MNDKDPSLAETHRLKAEERQGAVERRQIRMDLEDISNSVRPPKRMQDGSDDANGK